ncbi:hypothetical protein BDV32DRAFT_130946 [Aspergillus pseudonomiae]|nr:hypothetical protein BDV32DRAFT_130946 [Aspergillus pseudonomiae]
MSQNTIKEPDRRRDIQSSSSLQRHLHAKNKQANTTRQEINLQKQKKYVQKVKREGKAIIIITISHNHISTQLLSPTNQSSKERTLHFIPSSLVPHVDRSQGSHGITVGCSVVLVLRMVGPVSGVMYLVLALGAVAGVAVAGAARVAVAGSHGCRGIGMNGIVRRNESRRVV